MIISFTQHATLIQTRKTIHAKAYLQSSNKPTEVRVRNRLNKDVSFLKREDMKVVSKVVSNTEVKHRR